MQGSNRKQNCSKFTMWEYFKYARKFEMVYDNMPTTSEFEERWQNKFPLK